MVPSAKCTYSRWWNYECTRDYRRRKAAWKKLLPNKCPTNWKLSDSWWCIKRAVNRAKDDYDSKNYDYLSKSNKRELFAYLQTLKVLPTPLTLESCVLTPQGISASVEVVAIGLEDQFTAHLPETQCKFMSSHEFA